MGSHRRDETAMLAHDLRAPLGVILGYLALIEDGTFAVPRRTRVEVIGVVAEKAREMNRLIDDVLDGIADDAEHGRGEPVCDVRVAALEAVTRASARAALDGATIRAELPPGAVWASADPLQVGRILDNLIGNALTYSRPPASVTVEARAGDPVALVVRDHGLGIPEDERERVFEPRHRAHRDGIGHGLGLTLCRELAAASGGSVELESSAADIGSVFVVRLPSRTVGHG